MKIATSRSVSAGACGAPPTNPITCSTDVFVSGAGVLRLGDLWLEHCKVSDCHEPMIVSASKDVFVNGRGVARAYDALSCGDFIATGDERVRVDVL